MSCKGSCLSSVGADQPAEVVEDAPKHLVPLLFYVHESVLDNQHILEFESGKFIFRFEWQKNYL